jgi:hypothetical protein
LKEKTVLSGYPLPDITEILDRLGQAKYFSCLDLAMGYHQIIRTPMMWIKLLSAQKRALGL